MNDFYKNIIHHLIKDIIRIQSTGIPVDSNSVKQFSSFLKDAHNQLLEQLMNNPLIQSYLSKTTTEPQKDFTQTWKGTKLHRSYAINEFLKRTNHTDFIIPEWTDEDISNVEALLGISLDVQEVDRISAMQQLAKDKEALWNKTHGQKFNPKSSKQVKEFFTQQGIVRDSYNKEELQRIENLLKTILED